MSVTGDRGMDVVLDSLAGEFVDASLRLVAPGGVFLEMGKTDIRDPGVVAEEHSGVRYRAFDLFEAGAGPHRSGCSPISSTMFDDATLRPLPVTAVRCAARAGGVALSESGPSYRQGRADHAGCVGGGHGGDHRWYRDGGFGVGPACGGQPRCPESDVGESSWPGCAGGCGVGG